MAQTDRAVEATPQAREWIVSPGPEDEMPGIRNFAAVCGFRDPNNLPFLFETGATARPKQIIDGLIRLLSKEGQAEKNILRITIDELIAPVGEPIGLTLEDTVALLEKNPETQDASGLIRLLADIGTDVGKLTDEELKTLVKPLAQVINQRTIERLAEMLGVPVTQIGNQDYHHFLAYIAELSRRVGELEDFAAYQTSLHVSGKRLIEVAMLSENQVREQTGVECVLFATLNLVGAVKKQGGLTSDITLQELEARIPLGANTRYRTFTVEWIGLMQENGFTVSGDFIWADAINLMQQRKAGLILTVFSDHALAVVGVRQNNDTPAKIEFLVANSLSNYWPGKKLSWVKADELISKTAFLKPGETTRPQLYLASWPIIKLGS